MNDKLDNSMNDELDVVINNELENQLTIISALKKVLGAFDKDSKALLPKEELSENIENQE